MAPKVYPRQIDWPPLFFIALAVLIGGSVGLFVTQVSDLLTIILLIVALVAALGVLAYPQWGVLVLIFIIYTNFSKVAIQFHGAPSVLESLVALLGVALLVHWKVRGWQVVGLARPAFFLIGYGLVGLVSFFIARSAARVQAELIDYAKNIVVVVIILILLQRKAMLQRVIWALLVAGIFLGTVSVYQYLTGTFQNVYWGFGQTSTTYVSGVENDYRISGPLGNPNGYAQIMLLLVPVALSCLWAERRWLMRAIAGWALIVCTLTVMLTFSRGGFLALIVAFVVMLIRRPLHPIVLLVTVGALILAAQFAPESYNERISTLWSLIPGSETDLREDASFRGRLSERLAGWLMFQDHPLLGVGLNNYPVNYQDYSRQLGIDPRRENRSPDNLYVEIASEQGLLGLAAFGFILWGAFRAARQAQRDFNAAGLRDSAEIALAISVSLISYLISAMSKNSSYPDYFWLFIAIMLALPQVARNETNALKTQNADTIRISRTA